MKKFYELLSRGTVVIADGAMGTVLFDRGLKTGELPELLNLSEPALVRSVHADYVAAGAEIIYTDTFGANAEKLCGRATPEKVIEAAVKIALDAVGDKALVALDLGPTGRLMQPSGTLSFDEAYLSFKTQAVAGEKAGCDLVVLETFSSLSELRAAVLAVKENTSLPVMATMTFEKDGRTFTGTPASAFAVTISGLGADAIGVNCSTGPKEMLPVVREIAKYTSLPIVVKPNAGLPDSFGNYGLSADAFVKEAISLVKAGACIVGGCCGTTPDFIRKLSGALKGVKPGKRPARKKCTVLCSERKTVDASRPLIIGERLNPTGKKALKEAYLNGDGGFIAARAVEQEEAGADILDVNTGVPGADEKTLMTTAVNLITSVSNLPLSVDSSDIAALEAGLRNFPGKALVNSVNGEDSSLKAVLPLVKKYGAAVVGLCLDEKGVPKDAESRFRIASKIVDAALKEGIPREDIVIDCLTLTVSAEQSQAKETLKAIKDVKRKLKVKTVLGVSNISFGLPDRDKLNSAFLVSALCAGLDFAIINPNSAAMAYAFKAHAVLFGFDNGAAEYIDACVNPEKTAAFGVVSAPNAVSVVPLAAGTDEKENADEKSTFTRLIVKGLDSVRARTAALLTRLSPLEVVNEYLIPALDEVGKRFESGRLFLPQLISAAETAKLGFDEVKKAIEKSGAAAVESGTIVLATVKGDVHDIGKNIVKVVLENYGYRVIDLGKNVEISAVTDAVVKNKIKLLGLSALMTTTVVNMEKTIREVKKVAPDCKIMVGGAVLTPEYAQKIGADYYAKDANASVRIAKELFSC